MHTVLPRTTKKIIVLLFICSEMKSRLAALLLLLFLQFSVAHCEVLTVVDSGADLPAAVANLSHNGTVEIIIELYTDLVVDSPILFHSLTLSSLQGVGAVFTLTCSARNAGLVFNQTQTVMVSNVRLVGCAVLQRGYRARLLSSAVFIVGSTHVQISSISIESSPGTGLILNSNHGIVNISHSNFMDNRLGLSVPDEVVYGGGGVYLDIYNNTPHSDFQFHNCSFEGNVAENTRRYLFIFTDEAGESVNGIGRGGGIFVNMRGEVIDNSVTISRCRFINNTGFLGSGLSLEIEKENSMQNSILVVDCEIVENGCREGVSHGIGSGGGVQVSYRTSNTEANIHNLIKFQNVLFQGNCGHLGGGTYFFSNRNANPDTNNSLIFDHCKWQGNYARTGAAVDITPDIFERLNGGYRPVPTFRDCAFIGNLVSTTSSFGNEQQYDFGSSVLYSSLYNIKFESSAVFINNTGTAVFVVNAVADFMGSNATFVGNRGIQGGGLVLIGSSAMYIGPHNYSFINNIVTDKGGAIYSYLVDTHDFVVSRSCFLNYFDGNFDVTIPSRLWRARLLFEGNVALSGYGNDIFITSLLPCQVVNIISSVSNSSMELLDLTDIFQPPGMIFQGNVPGFSVSTDGARFSNNSGDLLRRIIPGEQYKHNMSTIDDLNHEIENMLIASFPSGKDSIMLDDNSYCLTDQNIQLKGQPHQTDTLLLQVTNARKIFATLEVELLDCPPGFSLQDNRCECDASSHIGLVRCGDGKQLYSYLRPGFWAGYVNTTEGVKLATNICPFGFCNYNSSNDLPMDSVMDEIRLPSFREELEGVVCGEERSGVLCGKCNPGFVVHFHSPYFECVKESINTCTFGWFLYILTEIVPATVLFIVILFFNISFTSGALNGFILFSQLLDTMLIDASGVITFPNNVQSAIQISRFIYGFFNLDFFYLRSFSFCLWTDASVLDIVAFKYVTIGYSVFLIIFVVSFFKYCGARCLGKYYRASIVRNSVIQGLSAFLVICYAQCIKASFNLLYSGVLNLSEVNTSVSKRVWYNGELEFLQAEHLPYALPALAVLLTIGIFPPIVLIFYPAIFRIMACLRIRDSCIDKCFPPYSALKPFLDAFQGSYKDSFRYFAGLYFIYRWIGIFLYAVVSVYSIFYVAFEIILIVILVSHALCQPYIKKWHNILDMLLLADLVVINRLTSLHYYNSRVFLGTQGHTYAYESSVLQVILIYLPLVYLVVYVVLQIMGKTCFKKRLQEDSEYLNNLAKRMGNVFVIPNKDKKDSEPPVEEEGNLPYRLVSMSIVSIRDDNRDDKTQTPPPS